MLHDWKLILRPQDAASNSEFARPIATEPDESSDAQEENADDDRGEEDSRKRPSPDTRRNR